MSLGLTTTILYINDTDSTFNQTTGATNSHATVNAVTASTVQGRPWTVWRGGGVGAPGCIGYPWSEDAPRQLD